MRPIADDMQQEIEELRDTVEMLRRNGREMPVMTLREYYAGLAMQAVIHDTRDRETCARAAIEYADALIAELQMEDDDE